MSQVDSRLSLIKITGVITTYAYIRKGKDDIIVLPGHHSRQLLEKEVKRFGLSRDNCEVQDLDDMVPSGVIPISDINRIPVNARDYDINHLSVSEALYERRNDILDEHEEEDDNDIPFDDDEEEDLD